jgi:hypothetical protein
MNGRIVRIGDLGARTREAMYSLFCSQFSNVSSEDFERDLEDKNWVLLLTGADGRLTGFSSMDVFDQAFGDRELTLVYSGDTVVDSSTWSDSALSYYWMGAVDWLRRHHGKESIYWFLLVSGYRTYRFLPVYSEMFYPRFDKPTPGDVQALMHRMAEARFNGRYDPQSGIVRLDTPSILRDKFSGIPEHRMKDPHIAFFAERNPGHPEGDELVCFSALSEEKLTRLGKRMFSKGSKLFPDEA